MSYQFTWGDLIAVVVATGLVGRGIWKEWHRRTLPVAQPADAPALEAGDPGSNPGGETKWRRFELDCTTPGCKIRIGLDGSPLDYVCCVKCGALYRLNESWTWERV